MSKAKRIVLFNHKGGVSKTTSTIHIGWKLAETQKVLLVDADTQCNLTGFFLGEQFDEYYLNDETKHQNLKDGVAASFEGRMTPIKPINCYQIPNNNNLFLIPGHPNLSEYETALSFAHNSNNAISTLQSLPGTFSAFLDLVEEKYDIDITLIDLNPSLSAINQNLFLSSHSFIIPTNPDPFSIMALKTLKQILPRWAHWKENNRYLFENSAYPMLDGTPKFLGSLIQKFNIRNGKANRPFRNNIDEIKSALRDEMTPVLTSQRLGLTNEEYSIPFIQDGYCLAEIPDFQSLINKSYEWGKPVFALSDEELGYTGKILTSQQEKLQLFNQNFSNISHEIQRLIQYV